MKEIADGLMSISLYIIPLASIIFIARKLIRIPDELFRKLLHFVLLGAYIPFVFGFDDWYVSAGVAASLIVILYPILILAGKISSFSSFVNERKKGEFKSSMILALATMVFSITICWGIFDDRYLVLATVYAWGIGDAFAALIGKKYGKHKIKWKLADSKKSVEGTLAMVISSSIAVFIVLLCRGGLTIPYCVLISILASLLSSIVELCTKNGLDTITCPSAAMLVIIPLVKLFGV